jgi:hypothetical protein
MICYDEEAEYAGIPFHICDEILEGEVLAAFQATPEYKAWVRNCQEINRQLKEEQDKAIEALYESRWFHFEDEEDLPF